MPRTKVNRQVGHNEFPIAHEYRNLRYEPDMLRVVMLYRSSGIKAKEIERSSGVTGQTLRNWESKKTRRPNHSTLKAVAAALGYSFKLMKE
jgi:transcriptional regulator with XRE-family HTH domain